MLMTTPVCAEAVLKEREDLQMQYPQAGDVRYLLRCRRWRLGARGSVILCLLDVWTADLSVHPWCKLMLAFRGFRAR